MLNTFHRYFELTYYVSIENQLAMSRKKTLNLKTKF